MTTGTPPGSGFFLLGLIPLISLGCGARGEADPSPPTRPLPAVRLPAAPAPATETAAPAAPDPRVPGETCLGVADKGIWSDLDAKVQLALPADLSPDRVSARLDRKRALLVLSIDGFPRKAYPLGGAAALEVGPHELALRPGDRAELARLLSAERLTEAAPAHDTDGDGIPDPLDLLIGAKKTVLNADAYTEGYISMKFPMGDVPREIGVCTDVIVRAVRNAGVDLQKALHDDILRAPRGVPDDQGQARSADRSAPGRHAPALLQAPLGEAHRRSSTIRPIRSAPATCSSWTRSRRAPAPITSASSPIRSAERGLPLVINNWTNGTVTAEMDLLTFVPVLYRFRMVDR